MRWFTSAKFAAVLAAAGLMCTGTAYACAQCYASSAPGVLHAYLVSVSSMIALAWGAIGAITLYTLRAYPGESRSEEEILEVGGKTMVSRRLRLLAAMLVAGGLILVGARRAGTDITVVKVRMFDTPAKFDPDPVKIKVGDTVQWSNKGDTVHTATTDPGQAPDPSFASVPKGATTFDSGFLNSGDDFKMTFTVPGVYHYFCTTHVKEGMKGEIDVAQ